MGFSTFLSCLAAWAHLQACETKEHTQEAVKAQPVAAQTTTHDDEGEAGYGLPARFSGFYLGLSAGYGTVDSRQMLNRGNNHGYDSVSPDGFVGSLTAGYNFAYSDLIVLGLEGDLGIAAISGDDKDVFDGHSWKPAFGPLWGTLRGRAGWLLTDTLMLYGTGGVAFLQTDNWTLGNNANESSWDRKLRTGFVIGGGVEYALDENWSAKAEYLYMDFGKHHGYTEDGDPYWYDDTAHVFRLGVNFRF